MKIKIEKLVPRVYVTTFDTQYALCMAFVRIQEFYESPKFKGKVFSLEEFMDYWSEEFGNGSFTYPSVWGGFNLPGSVILEWFGNFIAEKQEIRHKELELIKEIILAVGSIEELSKSYIIGVHSKSEKASTEHELAHAIYHLYPEYKDSCDNLIEKLPKLVYAKSRAKLVMAGYGRSVLDDEMQAYFSTSGKTQLDMIQGRKMFRDNFKNFQKKLGAKKN